MSDQQSPGYYTSSRARKQKEAALQVDRSTHPIAVKCNRLANLDHDTNHLPLPPQALLEEIYSEIRSALEESLVSNLPDTFDQTVGNRVQEYTERVRNAFEPLQKEIAQRLQVEKELKQSLALLRGTLKVTVDGIIVTQNARHIVAFNQKFVEMWGIPESIIASRDIEQVMPLILEQLKDPQAFVCQLDAQSYRILELQDGRTFECHSHPQWMGEKMLGRVYSFRDITLAKRQEAALHASEERFRAVVEQTSDGIFLVDPQTLRFLDANPAYCNLLGLTHEELLGLTLYDVVAIDREILDSSIQQTLTEKCFFVNEAQHRRQDGSHPADVEVNVTLISYGDREVFCAIVRDITERKQTEKALRAQEEFLQLVLDNIPQFIFWKDRNSVYLGCNRNFATAAGLNAPEEIAGKTDYDLAWKQEEADFFRECDARVMETDTPAYHIIEPQQQANGKQAWLDTNKIPLHDEQGQVVGILGTYEDISDAYRQATQRKQAEEALKHTKEELEIRVEERTALLRQAITSLSLANKQLQSEIEEHKQTEQALRQKATQLEVAMHELQQTQAQLIHTEKLSSLGQLIAGVAHEINNPLNFIHGNLAHVNQFTQDLLSLIQLYQEHYTQPTADIQEEIEVIDLDFIKEDLPKILSSMNMGADRIRQIVLSLRNFSRAEQAEMKWVDIHAGLDTTLLILSHRLKAKPHYPNIQVVKEYGNLPLVQGYAGQLNQVFMNILSNAIDALEELNVKRLNVEGSEELKVKGFENNLEPTNLQFANLQPATPLIRIRTEVNDSNQVMIRIADNGPGISEAVRSKLFNPFFTTKPIGQGTGLGMSISYQIIVEKHGGQLQCTSAPGEGAEFLICLPIEQPAS